ncbi:MAG: hypothetical protein EZS28_048088 [Streblomastix strix]|uniref:Transmembrane protein n=1 Tax=Streblomastix strix TaxID=222440 RepID=A0A5J4TFV9_9EUKA|nr:MAG: hypothetical protein EZS28_048088 [Streblomastix strix]
MGNFQQYPQMLIITVSNQMQGITLQGIGGQGFSNVSFKQNLIGTPVLWGQNMLSQQCVIGQSKAVIFTLFDNYGRKIPTQFADISAKDMVYFSIALASSKNAEILSYFQKQNLTSFTYVHPERTIVPPISPIISKFKTYGSGASSNVKRMIASQRQCICGVIYACVGVEYVLIAINVYKLFQFSFADINELSTIPGVKLSYNVT